MAEKDGGGKGQTRESLNMGLEFLERSQRLGKDNIPLNTWGLFRHVKAYRDHFDTLKIS